MDELGRCKSPNRPRQEGEPIGSIGSTGAWLHPGTRGANPAQKDGRVLELRNKVMLATVSACSKSRPGRTSFPPGFCRAT